MKTKLKHAILVCFIMLAGNGFAQTANTNDTVVQDFLKSGLTVVSVENFNGTLTNLAYETDFVYDKNIYFIYSTQPYPGKYRALYIIRPKQFKILGLDNQFEGTSSPFLIVGIQLKNPGYKIVKMSFVTFVEP